MEPTERLERLLDLTDRLTELVEAENLALIDHRYQEVEETLEDKAVLARLYENNLKDIEDGDIDISAVDGDLRAKLLDAGERLREAMDENTMRLEVGMAANQTVMEFLADAVKAQTPHAGTYSRRGRAGREGSTASANSIAVSLDQNL